LLTVFAAIVGLTSEPGTQSAFALWLALVFTMAHSFTTARAAPTNFSQRTAGDTARLEAIFDRFERWSRARSALQLLTLLSVAWGLSAGIAGT
jgi:hypothetical protein